MSKIDDQIIDMIRQRTELGVKQYGATVDRTDVPPDQWRKHLQEELVDALKYNQRCMNDERLELHAFIHAEIAWFKSRSELNSNSFLGRAMAAHVKNLKTRLKQLEDGE